MLHAAKIELEGIVQGVGFRPFVHRLSRESKLSGYALNTSAGLRIIVEGPRAAIDLFFSRLQKELPPLARIIRAKKTPCRPRSYRDFSIRESVKNSRNITLIPVDIAVCPNCLDELFDRRNRRFLYPFINCTDCGPRFSIIHSLPYDRNLTTMKKFRMCPSCRREYMDIADRRYHAQPNACARCGPRVELLKGHQDTKTQSHLKDVEAIGETIRLLEKGEIIAVKGIGGFHIACNAYDSRAIAQLRRLKNRPSKPFALMVKDSAEAEKLCSVSKLEKQLLESPERPIVLLRKRADSSITRALAPDNNYLGIMLCYAPLHYLLLSRQPPLENTLRCLVMTSANIADEPIEIDNAAAIGRLSGICAAFLVHDRPIQTRVDDSIVQVMDGRCIVLRRGRGYAPFPFLSGKPLRQIIACGAELKNTFCMTRSRFAFVSPYIGDLKTAATFTFFCQAIQHLQKIYNHRPKIVACDLHPDYLSSRYAETLKDRHPGLRLMAVAHHEAHLASVIAEHRIRQPVIGICFDGIGLGTDGNIWGGEFFYGTLKGFQRFGHLAYAAMPGADQATREPFRMAISYLFAAFGEEFKNLPLDIIRTHRASLEPLLAALRAGPLLTSSAGRLFDAVSALLGICDIITYEAQAAIRLQMFAERSTSKKAYRFRINNGPGGFTVDSRKVFCAMVRDLTQGVPREDIARKFHNGLAQICVELCRLIRRKTGITCVCLSGGVFQNRLFMETLVRGLRKRDFRVYYNELLPANDGAIALGQAAIADARCSRSRKQR